MCLIFKLQQLEEVLKDSDQKCGKAYDKLVGEKIKKEKEEFAQKALLNKRVGAAHSGQNLANNQPVNAGQASKKRRRIDFEELANNVGANFGHSNQVANQ